MSRFRNYFNSFPVLVGCISAALAAISGLVFPDILVPANLTALSGLGALLILISLVIVWIFQKFLVQKKFLVSAIAVILCLVALGFLIQINLRVIIPVDGIGNPPQDKSYLIGTELTEQGKEWHDKLGNPSISNFIKEIGPDNIPQAWGESYHKKSLQYTVSYLILAGGVVFLMGSGLINITEENIDVIENE